MGKRWLARGGSETRANKFALATHPVNQSRGRKPTARWQRVTGLAPGALIPVCLPEKYKKQCPAIDFKN